MNNNAVLTNHPRQSLHSEADVIVASAGSIIAEVFEHLVEHELEVRRIENGAYVLIQDGFGAMVEQPDGLKLVVGADDLAQVVYIKSFLVSHFFEFAGLPAPEVVWTGDGIDATTFPNFREMRVESATNVTPNMRRLRLSGRDLERYVVHGGYHLKIFLPPPGLAEPEWPVPAKDGTMQWPSNDKRPRVRTYTVRKVDIEASVLEVDVVLHGDQSIGTNWAKNAKPGDVVGARGPIGRRVPSVDWYLLVGDETALPGIARTIEDLPQSATGLALIEIADESEKQPIHNNTGVEIRWLLRNETSDQLVQAVRDVKMPPNGTSVYAMAGVEFDTYTAIRKYWREELKLDKSVALPVSYWRHGTSED